MGRRSEVRNSDDSGCKFDGDDLRHPAGRIELLGADPGDCRSTGATAGPGFSIFVTASTTPYELSDPVQVTVTVTNNTNHDTYWSSERVKFST